MAAKKTIQLLDRENTDAYIKYNYFDKEQSNNFLKENYHSDYLTYDKESDTLFCPSGKPMHNVGVVNRKNKRGNYQQYTKYRAVNGNECSLREQCHKSKCNRKVELNHNLRDIKSKISELLKSEQGIYHRKKRCYDVEPVFANIKHNNKFKQFNLKGLNKVEIETGLIALAHNLKKVAA